MTQSRDLRHSGANQSYAGVLLAPLSSTCLNSAMADKSGGKSRPNASQSSGRAATVSRISDFQLEECATSVPPLAHLATSSCLAVTDKGEQLLVSLRRRLDPRYLPQGRIVRAWPDYSRLRNSQETLVSSIGTLCNYSCSPIRLQNSYEECSDDVIRP